MINLIVDPTGYNFKNSFLSLSNMIVSCLCKPERIQVHNCTLHLKREKKGKRYLYMDGYLSGFEVHFSPCFHIQDNPYVLSSQWSDKKWKDRFKLLG